MKGLTPEEREVLPRMRRDLDLFDAYRAEDVRRLLDIIDRLDRALQEKSAVYSAVKESVNA